MTFEAREIVAFPESRGLRINMMPILMGDHSTVPMEAHGYLEMIDACRLRQGSTVYLSVVESDVVAGATQRRAGVHTDGTNALGWGGGWGGKKSDEGIYVASSDGACKVWDFQTRDVDHHGGLLSDPSGDGQEMEASRLYWMTDRTPHESMKARRSGHRQWFRLVGDRIGGWWAKHSTANPFGVMPNAPILEGSKFEISPG